MPTGNVGPKHPSVVIADDDICSAARFASTPHYRPPGLHYLAAAAIAFLVAAESDSVWNRTWTFHNSHAPVIGPGLRALVGSALSLGANQLFLLALVSAGAGYLAGQGSRHRARHALQLRGEQTVGVRGLEAHPGTAGVAVTAHSHDRSPAGFRLAPRLP